MLFYIIYLFLEKRNCFMKTFQIEKKTGAQPQKKIEPKGRQRDRDREKHETDGKQRAEKQVRRDLHGAGTKGLSDGVKGLVKGAPQEPKRGAEKKYAKLRHYLKSVPILPFALP